MAQYTKLSFTQAALLLQQEYGISTIKALKVLSGGSENTNYIVETAYQKYVLTICEQKSVESANDLANLLVHLNANGFPTSQVIPTVNKQLISSFQNKPVLLKSYLPGTIQKELSPSLLHLVGKQLALLHLLSIPDELPTSVAFGLEHFELVQQYADGSDFHHWLVSMGDYIRPHLTDNLPKALIHSDLFFNNIIVHPDEQQVTIMDFEEACLFYRVFDIGMTIVGTCCDSSKLDLHKTAHLLRGYEQVTPLLTIEKKALPAHTVYAATATAFWRHKNFNYVHVVPEKQHHYLEMKLLADHIKNTTSWIFD